MGLTASEPSNGPATAADPCNIHGNDPTIALVKLPALTL